MKRNLKIAILDEMQMKQRSIEEVLKKKAETRTKTKTKRKRKCKKNGK